MQLCSGSGEHPSLWLSWLVFIEQYDFEVLHRPGARHGNADGLSRKPMEEGHEDDCLV